MISKVYLSLDGILHQSRGAGHDIVGYICKREIQSPYARVGILQDSANWGHWCASNWITIPHDELWTLCKPDEALLSKVQVHNLDFRGTPFEHRHNEYVFRLRYWDGSSYIYDIENMSSLSEQERVTWGRYSGAFVPFKSPNPQGYQGVWGTFDILLSSRWHIMYVHDTFDFDIHALKDYAN